MRTLRSIAVALSLAALPAWSLLADVQVFVLTGQSNAVGFGADANFLPAALYSPQIDVRLWFEGGPFNAVTDPSRRIRSGGFVPLRYQHEPTGATFGGLIDGFGPEITLGRTLADALPEPVALVKFAFNATSLAVDWDPSRPGSLYAQMLAAVNDALGETPRIASGFWMQGEWDARNAQDAASYQANLTALVARLRTDLRTPDLPFDFGRLNAAIWMSPYDISQADLATVRAAQDAVAASVPRTTRVDTDDLELVNDAIHFAAAGQVDLGRRFAAAYLALAAPPVAVPLVSTVGTALAILAMLAGGSHWGCRR